MNVADSNRVAAALEKLGYTGTESNWTTDISEVLKNKKS